MLKWSLKKLPLELAFTWKIARNSSDAKANFIVELQGDEFKGKGEIAPNIRYGESSELIESQFEQFVKKAPEDVSTIESLLDLGKELELCPALRFGLESAYFDFLSQLSDRSIHEILGVNIRRKAPTSYSLPIMELNHIIPFIQEKRLDRFAALKIKIAGTGGEEVVQAVREVFKGPLRIDANEAFTTVAAALKFMKKIKDAGPIDFIEQPLPASMHDEYLELKKLALFPIMADESLLGQDISQYYVDRFDGVNIKLMKSGGYLRALKQLRRAKQLGLKTMIGCMIESSLGIASALNISHGVDYLDLDGFLLLKSDPMGLLEEENGVIKYASLQ